jgi:hypothetical protein
MEVLKAKTTVIRPKFLSYPPSPYALPVREVRSPFEFARTDPSLPSLPPTASISRGVRDSSLISLIGVLRHAAVSVSVRPEAS